MYYFQDPQPTLPQPDKHTQTGGNILLLKIVDMRHVNPPTRHLEPNESGEKLRLKETQKQN